MTETIQLTLDFAARHDLSWIESVEPEVFDEELKPEYLLPYLQDANHWLLLASSNGRIVGKCSAVVHLRPDKPNELYIDEIDVAPAYRKQGIAKAMLTRILEHADDNGIAECWVGTERDNQAARSLYEAMGAEAEEFVLYYLKD